MFISVWSNLFVTLAFVALAGLEPVKASHQTFFNWDQNQFLSTDASEKRPFKNIAIIGAGAGGTSAAYFLSQYAKKNPNGPPIRIHVFEKTGRVGGRALPIFFGSEYDKYEMGASSFVPVNFNLVNASRDFKIELDNVGVWNFTLGLYNGNKFVAFHGNGLFKTLEFYARYGWGFLRANQFANFVKHKFLILYDESLPPYESVEEMLQRVDLLHYVSRTSKDVLLNDWNAGPVYTDQLFQAIMRKIYAHDNSLHAFAGAISLIPVQGSLTARKGNDKFYIKFLEHSSAKLHLNSPITKLTRVPGGSSRDRYKLEVAGTEVSETFDAVILATPFHLSNIKVENLNVQFKEVPYKDVYVTVVEEAALNPAYFNLKPWETLPQAIFGYNATYPIQYILNDYKHRRVDIESIVPLSIEQLDPMFIAPIAPNQITFKHWKAYPVPTIKPLPLHGGRMFPPIILGPSFYYVNAAEPAVSCMEVEIMSARNIVRLVVKDL